MRKRLISLLICLCLALPGLTWAADVTAGFDELTIATFFEIKTNALYLGGFTPVVSWKELICVDAGLLSTIKKTTPFVGLGVNLQNLSKRVGWDFKLSEPLRVGTFIGRDFALGEWRYGVYVGAVWDF